MLSLVKMWNVSWNERRSELRRATEVPPWWTSESKVTLECSFSHDIHVSDLSADCSCDEYDLVAEANWIFSLRSSWNEARPPREMLLTGGSLFATKGKSVAPGNRDITRLWNDTDFRLAPCLLVLTYLRIFIKPIVIVPTLGIRMLYISTLLASNNKERVINISIRATGKLLSKNFIRKEDIIFKFGEWEVYVFFKISDRRIFNNNTCIMCTSIELPGHPIESPFAKDIPLRCNDTLPFLQFSTQPSTLF